jgi:hypothetical protein
MSVSNEEEDKVIFKGYIEELIKILNEEKNSTNLYTKDSIIQRIVLLTKLYEFEHKFLNKIMEEEGLEEKRRNDANDAIVRENELSNNEFYEKKQKQADALNLKIANDMEQASAYILTKTQESIDRQRSIQEGEKTSGGKRIAPAVPAYKLNGEKVSLLINKKKLHRSVYVKGNGKAKYCKINNEFVLLSKLKNKII